MSSIFYLGITLCMVSESPYYLIDPYTRYAVDATQFPKSWFDIPSALKPGQVCIPFAYRIYSYEATCIPLLYCTSYVVQLEDYLPRLRPQSFEYVRQATDDLNDLLGALLLE